MSLDRYRRKRDFGGTPEPRGRKGRSGSKPAFVIQQHDARAMHFDFRLEVEGVLKSWAVPKGPSTDPKVRRLALPTEDHPLEYAGFEGVIPEHHYGAGAVIVWDRGTYRNLTRNAAGGLKDALTAIRDGHFLFELNGEKLKGRYLLQRAGELHMRRWFLIKARDEKANDRRELVTTRRKSVLSGKTVDEIGRKKSPRAS